MKKLLLLPLAALLVVTACGKDQRPLPLTSGGNSASGGSSVGNLGGADGAGGDPSAAWEGVRIPAQLEAEDFVRAFESDEIQEADPACVSAVNPFVDTGSGENQSGGCSIGYAAAGEWLEYDVVAPIDGAHDLILSLGSDLDDRIVTVSIDGVVRGSALAPVIGWADYEEVTIKGLGLSAGEHIIRLTFDTGGVNLDYLRFEGADACVPFCGRRVCGDDFCGGDCGECSEKASCSSSGQCVGDFPNAVETHGQLGVSEGRIVNKEGEPVQLRGVSTQWLNWEAFYAGNPANMQFMRDAWGMEVYRIANGVEGNNGYADLLVREERLAQVKQIIETAIALDIYVLVDFHTHEESYKDLAVEFFSEIAAEYGKYPNLIYEPFNEPIGPSNTDSDPTAESDYWNEVLTPYYNEVIAAIRVHDPENVIVLGTPRWSQGVQYPAEDPIAGQNLAYTLHFYSCTHTEWLRSRADEARQAGIALFVTEWGSTHADGGTASNPGACIESARSWHAWLDEHKIGSTAWKLSSDGDASAILLTGAPQGGPFEDAHLSEHGTYLREVLQSP